jgi:uncharacterized protein YqeY
MPGDRTLEDVQTLRSALRADLVAAMKARQPDAVTALRTAIAAIDNAEAIVVVDDVGGPLASEHIAGARAGVGSTEAHRRVLSLAEVRAILEAQISERIVEANRYDALAQHDAASRLRREAEVLQRYVGFVALGAS